MLKLVLRALVVWAIEVVALLFLTWLLPGLAVVDLLGRRRDDLRDRPLERGDSAAPADLRGAVSA